ncbi:Uncharacterised protein [Helicobacter fennelliae]|uniref:Uncharacterized protein n=2 Tax=Helicobacter fennelliae TaxID=215 RepID=A0A2X3BFW2_9HELI|nr:hypothetical protein [Helicobacter fennelliae]SQB99533.1 Uncharacterised protein [Helicobacter fennelliae]
MQSSKNKLIAIIQNIIQDTMNKQEHLTPTLNDIYDSFNELGLRIDRNGHNSSEILKMLKNKEYKKWDTFIIRLLQVYKSQLK